MATYAAGVEVRAVGRTISGVAIPYSETSPTHHERFQAGGGVVRPGAYLDLDHEPLTAFAWRGAGLKVTDTSEGMVIHADAPRTPAGEEALRGVRSGRRAGLSVEFHAIDEAKEAQTGLRVVKSYDVVGFGLVPEPSYPTAQAEVRQRAGPPVSGSFWVNQRISCRCRDGCDHIVILGGALDEALAEAEAGRRVISAFLSGAYATPLARIGEGLQVRRDGDRFVVDLDGLPEGPATEQLLSSVEAGGYFALRPYFPDDQSTYTKEGTTAVFSKADLRGIEIAAITGPTTGLVPITVDGQATVEARRRLWL